MPTDPALINEYRDAFALFDKDGDGHINTKELGEVMRSLGHKPSRSELEDMIHDVDVDSNGSIEFEEFLKLMSRVSGSDGAGDDILDAFKVFDKDNDGYITHDELHKIMKQLGQNLSKEEINEMMVEADTDGDKKINFEEFKKMMK